MRSSKIMSKIKDYFNCNNQNIEESFQKLMNDKIEKENLDV